MESIARSLASGFTGVEVDIHETKDGVMVLVHDDSCDRQLGISGLIADQSWNDLRSLTLRQHTQRTPFGIPRLAITDADAFRRVSESAPLSPICLIFCMS